MVNANEILQKLKEANPWDNPKAQKAFALAELIVNHADKTQKSISDIAKYSLKRPRIARKERFSKKTLKKKAAETTLSNYYAAFDLAKLIAQPIPKYPLGRNQSGIIGERGNETIIMHNKTFYGKR